MGGKTLEFTVRAGIAEFPDLAHFRNSRRGRYATLPEILAYRAQASDVEGSIWGRKGDASVFTGYSVEMGGILDGEPVTVIGHGKSLIISPETIKEAKNKYSAIKFDMNAMHFPAHFLKEFMESHDYDISSYIENSKSPDFNPGPHTILLRGDEIPADGESFNYEQMRTNPLLIARAGGKANLERFLHTAERRYGPDNTFNHFNLVGENNEAAALFLATQGDLCLIEPAYGEHLRFLMV
ncbi:MAG: hypothetical protein AABX51_02465 [Nanoarchaeota archaeon]